MGDVRLFDIHLENSWIKEDFFRKLGEIYDQGAFTLGHQPGPVEELEQIFREACGRRHALAVGAGTHALHMAAWVLGLGPGDEVIVPANTFLATATAPALTGARIVACDVEEDTLNLSRRTVEAVMSGKTRAIFAVNLYGNPAPYEDLIPLGIPIVEDAAHSHGAVCRGGMSGGMGRTSAFSFFPTKVFGGIGDSGMILFDEDAWESGLKSFRNAGQEKAHFGVVPGNVYRMHVIQALFLLEKWKILPKTLAHRRRIASIYDGYFQGSGVRIQRVLEGCQSSYFAYVVRVSDRESVVSRLAARKIPTTVQYRYLLDEQPVWDGIAARQSEIPVARKISKEILSLPMNTSVTDEQARHVAEVLLQCL